MTLRIIDLMLLVAFVALAAAGICYEEHLAYFEVAAILLAMFCLAPVLAFLPRDPRRTPAFTFVLYSGMWAVFCVALVSGGDLGPSAQVLGLLMAVGIVVASACASLAARIGSW